MSSFLVHKYSFRSSFISLHRLPNWAKKIELLTGCCIETLKMPKWPNLLNLLISHLHGIRNLMVHYVMNSFLVHKYSFSFSFISPHWIPNRAKNCQLAAIFFQHYMFLHYSLTTATMIIARIVFCRTKRLFSFETTCSLFSRIKK